MPAEYRPQRGPGSANEKLWSRAQVGNVPSASPPGPTVRADGAEAAALPAKTTEPERVASLADRAIRGAGAPVEDAMEPLSSPVWSPQNGVSGVSITPAPIMRDP
jgi:hypothetical protein